MSVDPGPLDDPYPWLPLEVVRDHLGVVDGSPNLPGVDRARRAACAFVQDNRAGDFAPVLDAEGFVVGREFVAGDRLVQAALLAVARLDARKGSPNGLASYGEFATAVLRSDPDVAWLLGIGRFARPAIG